MMILVIPSLVRMLLRSELAASFTWQLMQQENLQEAGTRLGLQIKGVSEMAD